MGSLTNFSSRQRSALSTPQGACEMRDKPSNLRSFPTQFMRGTWYTVELIMQHGNLKTSEFQPN